MINLTTGAVGKGSPSPGRSTPQGPWSSSRKPAQPDPTGPPSTNWRPPSLFERPQTARPSPVSPISRGPSRAQPPRSACGRSSASTRAGGGAPMAGAWATPWRARGFADGDQLPLGSRPTRHRLAGLPVASSTARRAARAATVAHRGRPGGQTAAPHANAAGHGRGCRHARRVDRRIGVSHGVWAVTVIDYQPSGKRPTSLRPESNLQRLAPARMRRPRPRPCQPPRTRPRPGRAAAAPVGREALHYDVCRRDQVLQGLPSGWFAEVQCHRFVDLPCSRS